MSGELRDQVLEDLAITIQSDFGQQIEISNLDSSLVGQFIGNTNDINYPLEVSSNQGGTPLPRNTAQTVQAVFILKEILDFFGEKPDLGWKVSFIDLPGLNYFVKDVQTDTTQGVLILVLGE